MDSLSLISRNQWPKLNHLQESSSFLGNFRVHPYKISVIFDQNGFHAQIQGRKYQNAFVELSAPFTHLRNISKKQLKALAQRLPLEYSIDIIKKSKGEFQVKFCHKLCGGGGAYSVPKFEEKRRENEEDHDLDKDANHIQKGIDIKNEGIAKKNFQAHLTTQLPKFDLSQIEKYVQKVKTDPAFKQELFGYIEKTKKDKTKEYVQAASDSITVLNAAGTCFSGMDFKGIQIPGADLEGAILDGTNLDQANMESCTLTNAFMKKASLRETNMTGVTFGRGPLHLPCRKAPINYMAYSSSNKVLALAIEGGFILEKKTFETLPNRIELWDTEKGQSIPLTGNEIPYESVSSFNFCCFSKDGRWLATNNKEEILVWDMKNNGGAPRILEKPEGVTGYYAIAISPNSALLVATSKSDYLAIIVWDISTGKILNNLTHQAISYQLPFSLQKNKINNLVVGNNICEFLPSGKKIAIKYDHHLFLWNLKLGSQPVRAGKNHKFFDHFNGFVMHSRPMEERLLAVRYDVTGRIQFWDVEAGKLFKELNGAPIDKGENCVYSISNNGKWFVTAVDHSNVIQVYDFDQGKLFSNLNVEYAASIRFSASLFLTENWFATADCEGNVIQWELSKKPSLRTFERVGPSVLDFPDIKRAISSDGNWCVSWSKRNVTIWDVEKGTKEEYINLSNLDDVLLSDNGAFLAVSSLVIFQIDNGVMRALNDSYLIEIYRRDTGELISKKFLPIRKQGLKLTYTLVSFANDSLILFSELPFSELPFSEQLKKKEKIFIWDYNSGESNNMRGFPFRLLRLSPEDSEYFHRVSPSGNWFVFSNENGSLIYNQKSKKQHIIKTEKKGTIKPYVAFFNKVSSGGPQESVAVANSDGSICFYDLETGKECFKKVNLDEEYREESSSFALTNNGEWLFVPRDDFLIEIWNVKENRLVAREEGHKGIIDCSSAVSFDGSVWLNTFGQDNSIRRWKMTLGAKIIFQLESTTLPIFVASKANIESAKLSESNRKFLSFHGALGRSVSDESKEDESKGDERLQKRGGRLSSRGTEVDEYY